MHKCKVFWVPEGFWGAKNFLRAEGPKKISFEEPATFFTYIYTFEHLHYTNTVNQHYTVAPSGWISLVCLCSYPLRKHLIAMFSQM